MKKVPVFIFEEHHEAFFVWNYAVMNQLIQRFDNVLLHVDEHSDMDVPRFNYSINSIKDNLHKLYEFTYNELTIANFIIPAIYQGIFSRCYWLYQSNDEGRADKKTLCVHSHNREGRALKIASDRTVGMLTFFDSDFKNTLFKSIKTHNEFLEDKSIVLDIDLDYFSCNSPHHNRQIKLEVTKEQYDEFNEDKHHLLRISLGSGVRSRAAEGKYYMFINTSSDGIISSKLKVSEAEIIRRIDVFTEFLLKNKVEPQLIDICRSRLSGFTPDDQCEFIEEKLVEKLKSIYDIEINHIKEVLAQEKLEVLAS